MDVYSPEITNYFALIYGGSGTGKTHLAATAGELGKVLIIDADLGGVTVKTSKRLEQWKDNVVIASARAFRDLDEAAKLIDKNDVDEWRKKLLSKGEENKKLVEKIVAPFDWFVFDTWTEWQWLMLTELRKNEGLSGGGKLDFRKNIGIQHWGMLTDLNKIAIETFRDMGKNIIFNMQEVIVHDEVSGFTYGGPAIHGKMVKEMPAYFNIVVHTYSTPTGDYVASTKRKGFFDAKTRFGEPGEFKGFPTIKQVFNVATK
jgi:hypothetical protein